MKNILLLTAGFGEGEVVAAGNLRTALEQIGGSGARVEMLDLLDTCYGRFHDFLPMVLPATGDRAPKRWQNFLRMLGQSPSAEEQAGGLTRLRDSLRDALRDVRPDVVVSTSPLYNFLIGDMDHEGRTRDFTLISLVTNVVVRDSAWMRAPGDFFVVVHEAAARVLAEAGIPGEKIKVLGFPLELEADAAGHKSLTLPGGNVRPRILYVINSARKKAPKLLDRLLEHADWDVTVCVGRDTDLDELARAKAATAPERMEVIGHTRSLSELLEQHHLVIGRPESGLLHEAIAARCPLVVFRMGSGEEEGNFTLLREANAGVLAQKPREVVDWIERSLRDEGKLLALWRRNLESFGQPGSARRLAQFVLEQAVTPIETAPEIRALPAPDPSRSVPVERKNGKLQRLPRKLLLCDLHTHTTWSDGKLTVPQMVDFYGQRGFDCLCITDHLCDPMRLLGKLVNLTGLVIPPGEIGAYFEEIEREKKRAWAKYDLLLMAGVEFNKDGYTAKTSTHLLGVDLKQPINPSLDIKGLITEIHAQGALAIASHPHEMKSQWGKNTLYLWENIDEYAPLIDAWEVANRDDIFNPIGLKKLPFIANSDFHKPRHIHSWKTVLHCEKEAEAIKHCIRVNRDVSLTLYRDHRFGLDEQALPPTPVSHEDVLTFGEAEPRAQQG